MPHETLTIKYGTTVQYKKLSPTLKDDKGNPRETWKRAVFLYQEGDYVRLRTKVGTVGGREIVVPRSYVSAE